MLGVFYSVAAYRKKIVAFLVAVAVAGSTLLVASAQSNAPVPEKPSFDNSSREPQTQKRALGDPGSLFANEPNLSVKSPHNLGTRELFLKMMLSVLLVVVLGIAAIYISKKFGARITNLPGRQIRIIETLRLGPRKAVHLLKIGNQRLLISSTGESITKLADLTDDLPEMDLSETESDAN